MTTQELKSVLKTTTETAHSIHQILYNKNVVIVDNERRKIVYTSQTFSLDSDWISHIEESIRYEYSIEYAINTKIDYMIFEFDNIESLNVLDNLIKNKKEGKLCHL